MISGMGRTRAGFTGVAVTAAALVGGALILRPTADGHPGWTGVLGAAFLAAAAATAAGLVVHGSARRRHQRGVQNLARHVCAVGENPGLPDAPANDPDRVASGEGLEQVHAHLDNLAAA